MSGTAMPMAFWQKTFFDKGQIIPSSILKIPSHPRHCIVWWVVSMVVVWSCWGKFRICEQLQLAF
jgi:hypothetical protein